jgi:hypothetical protein
MTFSSSAISSVRFCRPTGGVDEQHVDALLLRLRQRIEGKARRIGALRAGDDRRAGALAPHFELLDGGGAEGIAGGEHGLHAER